MENKSNNTPIVPPCTPCHKPQNGIIVFGIGVLVGAIIATAAFMISGHFMNHGRQMGGQQMPQMQGQMQGPQGMPGQNSQNSQPPAMQGQNGQAPQQQNND